MAMITFRGSPVRTVGDLPEVGSQAPDSAVVTADLSCVRLGDLRGQWVVINIFTSIDTPVCATSVREFNERVSAMTGVTVLHVSMDLPFAQARFCAASGLDDVRTGSAFRGQFGEDYGVRMVTGPLADLLARAVVVVDPDGVVRYTALVPDLVEEPDYNAVLASIDAA